MRPLSKEKLLRMQTPEAGAIIFSLFRFGFYLKNQPNQKIKTGTGSNQPVIVADQQNKVQEITIYKAQGTISENKFQRVNK